MFDICRADHEHGKLGAIFHGLHTASDRILGGTGIQKNGYEEGILSNMVLFKSYRSSSSSLMYV